MHLASSQIAGPFRIRGEGYDRDREWGYSLLDVPHSMNVNGTFIVPVGAGHNRLTGGFGNALPGGWSVTMAARFQNG